MTTDNRTNEQVIKDELDDVFNDEIAYYEAPERIAAALRAANRLALPPGEDAVERARDAGMEAIDWDMVANGEGDPAECADIAIRAALAALIAARTAPQAESVAIASAVIPISAYPALARSIFAPVQPSSTMTAEAIADVLAGHRHAYTYTTDQGSKYAGCYCGARPKPLSAAPDDAWLELHRANALIADGAAPQAESDDDLPEDECPACDTPHDECSRDKVCCEDCSHIAGWPSVQPSSTVDEGKLADVLADHVLMEPNGGTSSWSWCECSCGFEVKREGATRDYVEKLARKHQARAVVEAIGGESRG